MSSQCKDITIISNPTNACIVVKTHKVKIVIDPWFSDGIYEGTWHNFPRLEDSQQREILQDLDAVLITHLHKDHFDLSTLKRLHRTIKIVIPKVFGWQVMNAQLELNGFKNIQLINENDNLTIGNLGIRLIPPINSVGLESGEALSENELCIDAGYRLDNLDTKLSLVFLADNNLYNDSAISRYHHLLSDSDLIAFAYSGFASDYPFNYKFNFDQMLDICNKGEDKRFKIQTNNLKKIHPKYILPYSSEFVPVGAQSNAWMKCYPRIWTSNKDLVAEKYAKELGCEAGTLYPNETLTFKQRNPQLITKTFDRSAIIDKMLEYRVNFKDHDGPASSKAYIIDEDLIVKAAENYFAKTNNLGLNPQFNFLFFINNDFLFGINNIEKFLDFSVFKTENIIQIRSDPGILHKLLTGALHWDDACLSFKLSWDRKPNLFDFDSYNSLHYLRLAPTKPTPPQP